MMRGVKKFFFITLWQGPTNSKRVRCRRNVGAVFLAAADATPGCSDGQKPVYSEKAFLL